MPPQLQTWIPIRMPSQVQTQAQVQAASQVQAPLQVQIQAQVQAQDQVQGPTQIQAPTQSQASTESTETQASVEARTAQPKSGPPSPTPLTEGNQQNQQGRAIKRRLVVEESDMEGEINDVDLLVYDRTSPPPPPPPPVLSSAPLGPLPTSTPLAFPPPPLLNAAKSTGTTPLISTTRDSNTEPKSSPAPSNSRENLGAKTLLTRSNSGNLRTSVPLAKRRISLHPKD
ncbi:MAG: hypothetical protein J3Q66DRAFT_336361 [Benniella sp.]|nr:MAG: hypothetical protein J3Q66DRAFT_336361 [Benniella sp.]